MSIIAEFHVAASDCLLQETLETASELRLEAERTVGYNRETFMPFLWVSGEDLSSIEATLRADSTVRDLTPLDTFDAAHLYEFDWDPNAESVVHAVPDADAAVLNARGRADTWEIQLRFADGEVLSTFQADCEANDIEFLTQWMMRPEGPKGPRQHNLTPTQRETLMAAYEAGYFGIPRATSLKELADTLGISHQSLSERLRRGYADLVRDTLFIDQRPTGDDEPESRSETE